MPEAKWHHHPLDDSQVVYGTDLGPNDTIANNDYQANLLTKRWELCIGLGGMRVDELSLFGPVVRPMDPSVNENQ